jgi:riboflavin transporter FmnP
MIKKAINNKALFDKATQILLPIFTILGFLFTSLKKPELGLIFNLISQVFWLYAAWQSWKKAGQIGIFITSIIISIILLYGVINYWIL